MIAIELARARAAPAQHRQRQPLEQSENGSICIQNESITPVSASPTSLACDSTSASNSVLPTTPSVSRIISCATSIVAPSRQLLPDAVRVGGHHRRVGGDAVAVKRRLHEAALAAMERVFAGQQPLAEQPLRALQPAALVESRWWVTSTSLTSAGSLRT